MLRSSPACPPRHHAAARALQRQPPAAGHPASLGPALPEPRAARLQAALPWQVAPGLHFWWTPAVAHTSLPRWPTKQTVGRGRKGCGYCNATRSRFRTTDSTHKPLHCIIPQLLKYVCFLTEGGDLSPDILPCLVQRFPDHAQLGPRCSKVTQGLIQRILSELASQGGLLLRQSTGGGGK